MNLRCAYSSALVAAVLFACVAVSASDQVMASTFTLENPSKKDVTISFPRPKPLVLTLADQAGAKQIKSWAKPIKEKFGNAVDIIGVPNLKAVPALARGPIRLMLKRNEGVVLLDWTGEVNEQYGAMDKTATILVVEPGGAIALRYTGTADDDRLERILSVLTKLTENQSSS